MEFWASLLKKIFNGVKIGKFEHNIL